MSFRQRFNDTVQQRVHSFDPIHVAVCTLRASCALYYKMFHFYVQRNLGKGNCCASRCIPLASGT